MRKKLVILSGLIAVNSLSYASGYDWQTPTENNWHVVIANGGDELRRWNDPWW